MYRNILCNRIVRLAHASRVSKAARWKSTLPPSSIFTKKPPPPPPPSSSPSTPSTLPPTSKTIPSPPRYVQSPQLKENKIEIKQSSLGPVAQKVENNLPKDKKEDNISNEKESPDTNNDVEELREQLKAGIEEEVKPETPIDHLYEKFHQEDNEKAFLNDLLKLSGNIALDPKESKPDTLAYVYAEHPSYPGEKFVPIFETEERLNEFYGKDHQFVSASLTFDMLFTGLNGLGLMVNPTSPYNFTLQSATVQDIGKMLERRRELDMTNAEGNTIEVTGDLELVEGMETERDKYIEILREKLDYFPEIEKAYIEIVREMPTQENKETINATDQESQPKQATSTSETPPQNQNTNTITEITDENLKTQIKKEAPHPLVIIAVAEDTSNKLFNSIARRLVQSIEDASPGDRLDVARYEATHHDEFIGETEPFYYGLFQKPKEAKIVKAQAPLLGTRRRVGFVSSKESAEKKKNVSKSSKKK